MNNCTRQLCRGLAEALLALAATATVHAQVLPGPTLVVRAAQDRHRISPDIYGVNQYASDPALFDVAPVSVQRFGGNATSRYNWLVDASNSGADFFFIGGSGVDPEAVVPGRTVDSMIAFDEQHGAKSIVTIPLLGVVNAFSQYNCSYWESDFPTYGMQWGQYDIWPFFGDDVSDPPNHHKCGSGLDPAHEFWENVYLPAKHPHLNHHRVTPAWMKEWVRHIQDQPGFRRGGRLIYQLDNEPESWSYIHHDVHPAKTGFDEVVNASYAYGSAVKSADRRGFLLGPSNWGVPAYWDMEKPGDDAASHGMPWFQYYLTRMRDYEIANGMRLLDYFDEHFYPQVEGKSVALSEAGDAETQAARLRSTRALWDPEYLQENWMGQYFPDTFGRAMVIPRLRSWTEQYYPGTKSAITEYNWGGLEHLNGALAQADVLGIFGREGLDLATLWEPPQATDPGAFAFRMYLNYDGLGGRYGDLWVESESSDQSQLAIYGAQRQHDGALTIVVINKSTNDLRTSVLLDDYAPKNQPVPVYEYSASDLTQIVARTPVTIQKAPGRRAERGTISVSRTPSRRARSRCSWSRDGCGPTALIVLRLVSRARASSAGRRLIESREAGSVANCSRRRPAIRNVSTGEHRARSRAKPRVCGCAC
jgi:hypothetical protein